MTSYVKKVKVASRGFFSTPAFLAGLLYSCPNKFPHSTPEAPHIIQIRETSTSEGGNYPPILPVGLNFKRIPLGFFTCRKAGTWDILFYFPSEGRHTEDFSDAWKIQRLRPSLNPRIRVPVASMLTTRPPKLSWHHMYIQIKSIKENSQTHTGRDICTK
jgi:hypothetical protein